MFLLLGSQTIESSPNQFTFAKKNFNTNKRDFNTGNKDLIPYQFRWRFFDSVSDIYGGSPANLWFSGNLLVVFTGGPVRHPVR